MEVFFDHSSKWFVCFKNYDLVVTFYNYYYVS